MNKVFRPATFKTIKSRIFSPNSITFFLFRLPCYLCLSLFIFLALIGFVTDSACCRVQCKTQLRIGVPRLAESHVRSVRWGLLALQMSYSFIHFRRKPIFFIHSCRWHSAPSLRRNTNAAIYTAIDSALDPTHGHALSGQTPVFFLSFMFSFLSTGNTYFRRKNAFETRLRVFVFCVWHCFEVVFALFMAFELGLGWSYI